MNAMTEEELFAEIRTAYSSLIHLVGCAEALVAIRACEPRISDQLIHNLIIAEDGSWRERLLGLVLACIRGPGPFAASMLASLRDLRGISIVPTCAVLAVVVRHFDFEYDPTTTANLDRSQFDGELGYAIDAFHHYIGLSETPVHGRGPNYGQPFSDHVAFYRQLCGA